MFKTQQPGIEFNHDQRKADKGMKSALVIFLFFFFGIGQIVANVSGRIEPQPVDSDSIYVACADSAFAEQGDVDSGMAKSKHFFRASGEMMFVQLLPWAWNYEVRKASFAHITSESLVTNMKPMSWTWDDNNFRTNQFAHPYHGNLYYSAFRSNGYTFWESSAAAVAGSFVWETMAETHLPAPNDWINTSLGGIAIGEISYRLATRIVNERQTGLARQVNEVLAFLVNPMNGITRILDGRWGRVSKHSLAAVPAPINGILDAGARRYFYSGNGDQASPQEDVFVRASLLVGNPYRDYAEPFSNFFVSGELGALPAGRLNSLQVQGLLFGKPLLDDDHTFHLATVTMNYDYIKNNVIQYGAQGFACKLLSIYKRSNESQVFTEAGIHVAALAAIRNEYMLYGEGRNYDYCQGAGFLAGVKTNFGSRLWCGMNYKGSWYKSCNGFSSDYFLTVISADVRVVFTDLFSMGLQAGKLIQVSHYADYDTVKKGCAYLRFSIGCHFGS